MKTGGKVEEKWAIETIDDDGHRDQSPMRLWLNAALKRRSFTVAEFLNECDESQNPHPVARSATRVGQPRVAVLALYTARVAYAVVRSLAAACADAQDDKALDFEWKIPAQDES